MLASIIRTLVPMLVGWALSFPAVRALGLTEDNVTPLVSAIAGALYYIAVRALEQVWPAAGALLGWAQAPTYAAAAPDASKH